MRENIKSKRTQKARERHTQTKLTDRQMNNDRNKYLGQQEESFFVGNDY